jgi:hypothetical protein
VAVSAIDTVVADMVFVAELHRLHHFVVLVRDVRRSRQLREHEEGETRYQHRNNETSFRNVIR